MKYIAVKIKGINHWFWFDMSKVTDDGINFKGSEGWGRNGSFTSLEIQSSLIEGRLYSDAPQYN